MARQGKRLPSALETVTISFLIVAGLVLVGGQILSRLVARLVGTATYSIPIGFLLGYAGMWVWLRFSVKRPFWSLGFEKVGILRHAFRGALVAGMMVGAAAGLAIIPGASMVPPSRTVLAALGIGLVGLLGHVVQGSAEEMVFRGWLLPVIGARYSPWIGVVVSSLLFSVAHAQSPGITLIGFLNLFLFGVFAAFYALSEGGLWGICLWHAVWNWAMGDLLGLALDGTPHPGILISILPTGPDIVTGGAFGLEGGIAATTVFLIGIGVLVTLSRRSGDRHCNVINVQPRRRSVAE